MWALFWSFFKIGLISFGGGYAMIPVIEHEVFAQKWMTSQEFIDIIALSGMSPGPIATNSAILVGYKVAGYVGAIVSTVGIILPSLLIIIILAALFHKVHRHKLVRAAFYGTRPIIMGFIVYAVIYFSLSNGLFTTITWHSLFAVLIFAMVVIAVGRFKLHPIFALLASGLIGVVVYA